MIWDRIGKLFQTNDFYIEDGCFRKKFGVRDYPALFWGFLDRKPVMSARDRYEREKTHILNLSGKGLNTPVLMNFYDRELTLEIKVLDITSLVNVFTDTEISFDDKLFLYLGALHQLKGIHDLDMFHGDAYLRNFFRINNGSIRGQGVYTCDFEHVRKSPFPKTTDVLVITANTISLLGNFKKIVNGLESIYEDNFSFPFGIIDKAFFRARFGVGKEFFDYFSR